ncbi:hypothetical protein KEM60_01077 [Austwickia sp. TVS 96-490-7B]|uniref:YjfB family protein n=1 Tax=Austwickia sp. TVS 96-490-7B TaxID=2830843 RepID=UPI001C56C07A|nr:YjfB family protein [Austwickia sp. TVS 96-490-7B]MBW3084887.1 hypothetical protein [Austwickia sp. TVS 96-490-7B]
MDVAALAQSVLGSRADAAMADAQISVLKKAMDTQGAAATKLLDSLALPLATEGALGRHVNTYC